MPQEILYTSAPQGLRQGTVGFSTVAATSGLEPNLVDFLEGFSGYTHPFKPPDPRTADNPVNFSFIQWSIGGQRMYVLSRVCDAGLDYSGRTNLLAHHVVLTRKDIDRCPGGPAWVMAPPHNFFRKDWDGQIRALPTRDVPIGDITPAHCTAWERATGGDAGYAGVLAEAAREKSGRPVTVIYPASLNNQLLALVVEAQMLLPIERRWNVTFSTFYSRIYSSFDVQWRFVFGETSDAHLARRDSQSIVIDLCKGPLPKAQGGEFVAAARENGVVVHDKARVSADRARPAPAGGQFLRPGAAAAGEAVAAQPLSLAPPEAPPIASTHLRASPFQQTRRQSSSLLYVTIAGIGSFIFASIVFAAVLLFKFGAHKKDNSLLAEFNTKIDATGESNGKKEESNPPPETTVTGETETTLPPASVAPPPTTESPATPIPPDRGSAPGSAATVPGAPTPAETVNVNPFAALDGPKQRLALPPRKGGIGGMISPAAAGSGPLFTSLNMRSPEECELELVGIKEVFGNLPIALVPSTSSDLKLTDFRTWKVVKKKEGLEKEEQLIGTFKLERPPARSGAVRGRDIVPHPLTFRWNGDVPNSAKPDALPFCLLKITVGVDYRLCRLSEPIKVEPMILVSGQTTSSSSFESSWLADIKDVQLELQPTGIPSSAIAVQDPAGPVPFGQKQRIVIKNGNGQEGPRVGVAVEFKTDEKTKSATIRLLCKIGYKTPDVSDEQAVIDGFELDEKLVDRKHADAKKREGTFGTAVKALVNSTQKKKNLLDEAIRGQDAYMRQKHDALEFAKKTKNKVDELIVAREIETAQNTKLDLEGQLFELQKELESRKVDLANAKEDVRRLEGVQKFLQGLRNARLEYRMFFAIDKEDGQFEIVDLYRSKGVTDEPNKTKAADRPPALNSNRNT